jgi:GNAT superfamily N-acetyltransferase
MKGILLLFFTLLFCIYHLDAFLTNPYHPRTRALSISFQNYAQAAPTSAVDNTKDNNEQHLLLGHKDIIWKLRPPPETSWWKQLTLRLASNVIRLECKVKGIDPPFCLCPKGGRATLEAHILHGRQQQWQRHRRVGKFGITTLRGPPADQINESVQELYGIDLQGRSVGSAAIIYMSVEPSHRHKGIGALALEVVSTIHAMQGVDFTLLVADDDGSGKLVAWYEAHGYKRAPKLQDILGSPGGKYGVTMIGPTNPQLSPACRLQWW